MTGKPKVSLLAPLTIVAIFATIAVGFISSGTSRGRGANDDLKYHSVAIKGFIEQWPAMDFSDYASATTPGYHVLLATAGQMSDARWWLRTVGALFTIGLLWTLARSLSGRMGSMLAIVCTLPLLSSMYVIDSGVYLLPDNIGWLGVLGVMVLALDDRFGSRQLALASLVLFALVWCRQIHIWSASIIWAAAWIGSGGSASGSISVSEDESRQGTILGVPLDDVRTRGARLAVAIAAAVPAFVVLISFYLLWGRRLSPPQFEELHTEGISLSTPAFFLSLFGIGSAFFVGWWWPSVREAWTRSPRAIIKLFTTAVAFGLVFSVIPETTYSVDSGRFSGLWNAVPRLPVIADRSLLLACTSVFGAVTLVAWCTALPARPRLILLASVAGFVAAQSANPQVWQRYHEPFILILIAVMASFVTRTSRMSERVLRLAGPLALAIMLAAITVTKS